MVFLVENIVTRVMMKTYFPFTQLYGLNHFHPSIRANCLLSTLLWTLSAFNPCELSSIHPLVDTFALQSVRTVFYPPSSGHFLPSVRANCLLSALLWTLSAFNPCELSSIHPLVDTFTL